MFYPMERLATFCHGKVETSGIPGLHSSAAAISFKSMRTAQDFQYGLCLSALPSHAELIAMSEMPLTYPG